MSLKKRIARRAFVVFVIGVFFFSTYFPAFPGLTIYAAERTGEKVDESTLTTETDSTLEASETEATTVEQEQEVTNEEEKAHLEEEESSSSKQEEPVTKEENKQQENDVKEEKTEEKAEEPLTEIEQEQEENQQETIDYAKLPPLLITELAPDSQGTDNFEFIELYNNTNQPIDLNSYYFYYHYIGGSTPDKIMSIPATTIAPQQSIVLWFNVKDLKIEDFNKHFSTSLTEHQVISFKGDFPGFANGGNRGVVIKNLDGQEVVSATYSSGETDNTGLDVHYAFPTEGTEMVNQQVKASPTPAVLGDGQVPTEPLQENPKGEDTEAPVITHEAKTTAKAGEAISFEATIVDDHKNPSAIFYYQVEPDQIYKAIEMQQDSANPHKFTANIPKEDVQGNIAYYLEATDNKNIAKTSTYTIELEKEEAPEPADTYSDRPLLITELAPNSIGGGTDYYEYFELYNNSNQTLNLAAYSFYYVYTDLSREPVLFQLPATEMKSKEKLVFWFNNGDKTLEDFNKEYGTNLTSNEVVMFTDKAFPGFANGGNRALEIKDSDGKVMISASYLGSENDNDGKVVHYQFPHEGMEMAKYKVLADPSPGTIEANQVPTNVVELPEVPKDTGPPVISHNPIQTAKAFPQ